MRYECTDLTYKFTNIDYISETSLPSIQQLGETGVHSFCENLFKGPFTAIHGKCYIAGHVWEKKHFNWMHEYLTDCQIVTGLCAGPKLHMFCWEQETAVETSHPLTLCTAQETRHCKMKTNLSRWPWELKTRLLAIQIIHLAERTPKCGFYLCAELWAVGTLNRPECF